MLWRLSHGDILDVPADVLICSANPYLNLSGGVGGALLGRYGDAMQRELHGYLAERGVRFVQQGEVVQVEPCGTPYRAVLHAVAIDAFYESSSEVITGVVAKSLELAAALEASRVTLTALATGYGRLSLADFARGLLPLAEQSFGNVAEVLICVLGAPELDELHAVLGHATRDDTA
jgi:O-acetyl-ADP-ribose deacetylase (regulator of RNase III)